jgi:hypothetical protein
VTPTAGFPLRGNTTGENEAGERMLIQGGSFRCLSFKNLDNFKEAK